MYMQVPEVLCILCDTCPLLQVVNTLFFFNSYVVCGRDLLRFVSIALSHPKGRAWTSVSEPPKAMERGRGEGRREEGSVPEVEVSFGCTHMCTTAN